MKNDDNKNEDSLRQTKKVEPIDSTTLKAETIQFLGSLDAVGINIQAVNELTVGLGRVMPDKGLALNFNKVVDFQNSVLNQAAALSKKISINVSAASTLMASAIAPLSGAIATIGLVDTNSHKLFEAGAISAKMVLETTKLSNNLLDGINSQQSIIADRLKSVKDLGVFNINMSGVRDAARLVSSGISSMFESLPAYSPSLAAPSLGLIQRESRLQKKELSEHQKKLDIMLTKIDPALVEYRQGCWHTLQEKGPDHLGQASSSMRRVIDNLLRKIAPNEEVVKTQYFKDSKTGEGGKDKNDKPTRKARLFYIMKYESKPAEHAEHIIRLVEGLLKTYDSLSAWDHIPIKKDLFVEGAFTAIEGHLISLLSELYL